MLTYKKSGWLGLILPLAG